MNFAKAQKSYSKNAIVQKEMAKKLFRVLGNFSPTPSNLLEIGSGTGFLTEHLITLGASEFFLNDINPNQTGFSDVTFLQGDIREIEIPCGLDLIASNAVFQWIDDLDALFSKLHCALAQGRKGGMLAFTTFGSQNYRQFGTQSMLNYPTLSELERMLVKNSFEVLHLEEELVTLYYANAREVLEHIRATGVTTFSGNSRGLWTKDSLRSFEKAYLARNSDANGVELTYHPIYCCAKSI